MTHGRWAVSARQLLARYLPITAWLPAYPRAWVSQDIMAGIASWAVMVPVATAYAELAGVPAGIGLITATAGPRLQHPGLGASSVGRSPN